MSDDWKRLSPTIGSHARHGAAVTPDDDNDLSDHARALYVGGGGDVELVTLGGDTLVFKSVPAGAILPVATVRVRAAGTTATHILALW